MVDFVQARLDVKRDTAADLVFAARRFPFQRELHNRMLNRGATFDRTVAAVKLADAGALPDQVTESYDRDLAGVSRMTARTRHVTPTVERRVFSDRYFTIQPNLDESRYRMWGEAPGVIGRTIDKAISQRADELHIVADDLPSTRGQRQLDAFGAMALDSLEGTAPQGSAAGEVIVFVDARQDDPTQTTGEVQYGPRVGPDALEQLQCGGRVQIIGLDANGIPVVTTPATRTIPPAIRHTVAYRDGACVIDGCASRYRLQPHHITVRSCAATPKERRRRSPPPCCHPRQRLPHRPRLPSPQTETHQGTAHTRIPSLRIERPIPSAPRTAGSRTAIPRPATS
jgi:hypothetical protein